MGQRIRVTSVSGLERALNEQERKIHADLVRTCRRAAEFGRAKAIQLAQRARLNATRTYSRSFVIDPIPNGAILANTAKHAYFVEKGRQPGRRPPPIAVILLWMMDRKIIKRIPVYSQAGLLKVGPEVKGKPRRILIGKLKEEASRRRLSKREAYIAEARLRAIKTAKAIGRRGFRGREILGKTTAEIKRFVRGELNRVRRGDHR